MSKFVLDGVMFDLNNASVTNVNGAWIVNTNLEKNAVQTVEQIPTPTVVQFVKGSHEEYKARRREYQRRYMAKKKLNSEFPVIPTLNSKYESTLINKQMYGSVSQQVRDKFKQVGDIAEISAHSTGTIYSAFAYNKIKATMLGWTDKNTWRFKRIA